MTKNNLLLPDSTVFRSKILPVVEEGKSVFWGTILNAEERDWPFELEVVGGDKVPLSVRNIKNKYIQVCTLTLPREASINRGLKIVTYPEYCREEFLIYYMRIRW